MLSTKLHFLNSVCGPCVMLPLVKLGDNIWQRNANYQFLETQVVKQTPKNLIPVNTHELRNNFVGLQTRKPFVPRRKQQETKNAINATEKSSFPTWTTRICGPITYFWFVNLG